jgi:serine/threonine protein kinase
MHAPQTDTLIGRYFGRYHVSRRIGTGRMGSVYEVVQQSIGHRAAMKVLRPEFARDPKNKKYLERFIDEARAVNLINHPGVVQVFDLNETDDQIVYILMEYLDGFDLASYEHRVQQGAAPRLSTAQLLGIVKQLASVLAVAHDKGILHRDIKPQDIFLTADANYASGYRAKLLDFGVALFLDTPERRTTAGIALGTPLYMSPEQCLGADDIDGKTDVYSLGAILYEALAGAPPFVGDMSEVMRKHVRETPLPLAQRVQGTPPAVVNLVDQMLAKRKEDRPTSREVEQRITQLEKSGELDPPRAPPPAPVKEAAMPPPAPGRRLPSPVLAVALLAAGVVLGGGGALLLRRPPPPMPAPAPTCVQPPAPAPPPPAPAPAAAPAEPSEANAPAGKHEHEHEPKAHAHAKHAK